MLPIVGMKVKWANPNGKPQESLYINTMRDLHGLGPFEVGDVTGDRAGWFVTLKKEDGKMIQYRPPKTRNSRLPGSVMQVNWKYLQEA